ncbi:PREDICTED: acid phosphatase 1-like isoform X3 [Ipomoea nil]|uniref:acid phosphatase 1-like isoform X3 n=1 Tax=Ipomoea nil TaxID=35883 RepID=UPI000901BE85|nr:PREDICTED: acid phosphatase 1-like isoform X3 [Ipomoea nil]
MHQKFHPVHGFLIETKTMKKAIQLLFLVTVTAWAVTATPQPPYIQQVVEIHRLRPQTGSAGHRVPQIDCLSWRLGVETNNIRGWKLVPSDCENYVGHYMLGKQYRDDCEVVADAAIDYANSLTLSGDGKDIWVFDIDETTLSNLPYYARSDVAFGAIAYNSTKFNEWVREAKSPVIPASLRLYNVLLSLGIRPVFLTGVREVQREARATNLLQAGYHNWEKLIFKGVNESGSGVVFKSGKRTELVNAGYRIVGNMGDQWSDLLGPDAGDRTFKVPDPMYYIA